MAGGWKYEPKGQVARFVHSFEENVLAMTLGLMTVLTFLNVIRRYLFNASLIWSLEVVLTLFAWLVMIGIAYGFKVTAHLGVDAVTNLLSQRSRRIMGLISGAICIFFAVLLLKGAWDYWAPFAELPRTTGRWLPTGIDWNTRGTSYFETDQIPMPGFLKFLEDWINYGETYSKLPRTVPYVILPIAAALILLRIVQATVRVWNGEQDSLIVSHEAEDAVEEAAAQNREA